MHTNFPDIPLPYMSFEEYEYKMAKAKESAKSEDMSDPHCKTMEELNEWANKHGCMNFIFELNFSRIMFKKRKMGHPASNPDDGTDECVHRQMEG